jgi:hypothetical protein
VTDSKIYGRFLLPQIEVQWRHWRMLIALTNKTAVDLRITLHRTVIWDNDVSGCRFVGGDFSADAEFIIHIHKSLKRKCKNILGSIHDGWKISPFWNKCKNCNTTNFFLDFLVWMAIHQTIFLPVIALSSANCLKVSMVVCQ